MKASRSATSIILILLLIVFLVVGARIVSAAEVDPRVMKSLEQDRTASVIVILKEPAALRDVSGEKETTNSPRAVQRMQRQARERVLSKLRVADESPLDSVMNYDLKLKQQYSFLNGFSGEVTEEGLLKLKSDPNVKRIVPNEVRQIFLTDSVPLINATKVWNLSIDGIPVDGRGQTVCVIDTGVDYTHPGLGGCTSGEFTAGNCAKVPYGYDFANGDDDPVDDHGHGTHVAGIVASTDEVMGPYKGVAPNAKIVAMKVCDASGSCWDSDVLAGIEKCIDKAQTYNISVISISLGGDQTDSYCDAGIGAAYAPSIDRAVGQNISVVIATGNTGNGYSNETAGISLPACLFNSTKVTATTKTDSMASYAFRHSAFSDIVAAPGSSIVSLQPGGATAIASGTSMATPHVSGVVALLQEFAKGHLGRMLTPTELKAVLNATGKPVDDSSLSGKSYSRVDVYSALLSLDTVSPILAFTNATPVNGSTVLGSTVTIEFQGSETLFSPVLEWNGVNESVLGSGTTFTVIKSGLRSGEYQYKVYAQDVAGRSTESELRTVMLEGRPSITFNTPSRASTPYVRNPFSLNITLQDSDGISFSNYSITDLLGNIFQLSSVKLGGAVEFSYPDAVNISNPLYVDGNYTIAIYVNDTLGDASLNTSTFVVDKTAPQLTTPMVSPGTIFNTQLVQFLVNATDSFLNTSLLLLQSNFSGTWRNYSLQLSVGDQFVYTLNGSGNLSNQEVVGYKYWAVDFAGNANSSDELIFRVQNRVPLSVAITSPSSFVWEVGSTVLFNGNGVDEDGDALTYSWNFGDGSALATAQSASHLFNSTGALTVVFNISDPYSSNSTPLSILVNDTTPPRITSLSYDAQHHVQDESNQSVTATLFDYSGISSITLVSEGITRSGSCSQSSTSWNCAWSWSNTTNGNQEFTITVADNFNPTHQNSSIYNFQVLSCTDGVKNGNEQGVDCGGSCLTSCPVDSGSSSSSSGGGGGGGGGGGSSTATATTAAVESAPDSDTTENEEKSSTPGVSETTDGANNQRTEKSQETQQVNQDLNEAAEASSPSLGNRITGFFGRIVPTDFSLDFNGKSIALMVMGMTVLGLGSLYFFLLRER